MDDDDDERGVMNGEGEINSMQQSRMMAAMFHSSRAKSLRGLAMLGRNTTEDLLQPAGDQSRPREAAENLLAERNLNPADGMDESQRKSKAKQTLSRRSSLSRFSSTVG
jgi:aconitase A